MEDILNRFVTDLIGRLSGPLTLRLFLQPGVAIILALRDGVKDAREGRPPHFWRMVTGPAGARRRREKETRDAVLKVFVMAVVLDCVYQLLVSRWIAILESLGALVSWSSLPVKPPTPLSH